VTSRGHRGDVEGVLLAASRDSTPADAHAASRGDVSFDYAEMFRAHYGRVVRWLSVLGVAPGDVDDAAQEVFIVAHRRGDRLHADATVTGWLLGISRRIAATSRRTRERATVREERAQPPPATPDPESVAMRREAAEILQRFLASLPEQQRLVFALYELDGEDATSIAQMLDLSPNTVHSRVRLMREKLARFVARERSRDRRHHG
jgi:RNA polymerase sigma-70 factor (ECF subfamily)